MGQCPWQRYVLLVRYSSLTNVTKTDTKPDFSKSNNKTLSTWVIKNYVLNFPQLPLKNSVMHSSLLAFISTQQEELRKCKENSSTHMKDKTEQ